MDNFDRVFGSAKLNLGMDKRTMFYAAVLFGMRHVLDDPSVERAATDGPNLYLNREWFAQLTLQEAIGVLAHEVSHVIHEHVFRALKLNHKIHNYAADYLINNELDYAGVHLPKPNLMDHKYDGYSLIQIYNRLLAEHADFPEITLDIRAAKTEDTDAVQSQLNIILTQAVQTTRMGGGTVPATAERFIQKLHSPEIDWEEALLEYAESLSPKDYSWGVFDESFLPRLFLPGLSGNDIGEIAFAIDSSGSVSDKEFNSFRAAAMRCREIMQPDKTTIVDFTTQINNVYELDQFQELDDFTFDGWGGTDLHPVIEFFDERQPTVLVVFSDLDCCPIETPPDYPIVWVCVNAPYQTVNFGKLIHYSTEHL